MCSRASRPVGIGGFAIFVVPWLIPVLYTDGYGQSVLVCQLILVSTAIQCFSVVKCARISGRGWMWPASVRFVTVWSAVKIVCYRGADLVFWCRGGGGFDDCLSGW